MSNKQKQPAVVKTAMIAMFSAVAFVLYLLEIPVLPSLGYLKIDFSEIPVLIGALYMGPAAGIVIELLKNLIELLVKGLGTTMGYGNIMNFLVGCAYVIPFVLVYRSVSKKKSRVISCILASLTGMAVIIAVGIGGNYLIAPVFFREFMKVELTKEALWASVWGATALNGIKGVMLSAVSFPIVLALLDRMKKTKKS